MSSFDKREQGFEGKFARDEELAFKINARRNKLLGLWAAAQLAKPDAEAYAREVVLSDFEQAGDDDVIAKLMKDFAAAGVAITEQQLRAELEKQAAEARKQLEAKS